MTNSRPEYDVVVIGTGFGSRCAASTLREAGIDSVVVLENGQLTVAFDDANDLWTVRSTAGRTCTGRVVISVRVDQSIDFRSTRVFGRSTSAAEQAVYRSVPGLGSLVRSRVHPGHGALIDALLTPDTDAYLGIAAHGVPNYFRLMGPKSGVGNRAATFVIEAQAHYIVSLISSMNRGESTRIEVKAHVQAQFNRGLPCRTIAGKTIRNPNTKDFEFTRPEDRDGGDEYRGPAVLIGADGIEHSVFVHLLSLYQPIDNTIHWAGRITPCAALVHLHAFTNTPITLRIADNDPVPGVLTDSDPWGGARIVGSGASPYPIYDEPVQLSHP